jgi:hypothetical protein
MLSHRVTLPNTIAFIGRHRVTPFANWRVAHTSESEPTSGTPYMTQPHRVMCGLHSAEGNPKPHPTQTSNRTAPHHLPCLIPITMSKPHSSESQTTSRPINLIPPFGMPLLGKPRLQPWPSKSRAEGASSLPKARLTSERNSLGPKTGAQRPGYTCQAPCSRKTLVT